MHLLPAFPPSQPKCSLAAESRLIGLTIVTNQRFDKLGYHKIESLVETGLYRRCPGGDVEVRSSGKEQSRED
jgi:hypothetical protein